MGNLPILTPRTSEIASQGPQGKDVAPRIEMVKRLFLDGIGMNSRDPIVDEGIKHPFTIDTGATDSLPAFRDDTPHGTDIAADFLFW
jgi:hypothetical protein